MFQKKTKTTGEANPNPSPVMTQRQETDPDLRKAHYQKVRRFLTQIFSIAGLLCFFLPFYVLGEEVYSGMLLIQRTDVALVAFFCFALIALPGIAAFAMPGSEIGRRSWLVGVQGLLAVIFFWACNSKMSDLTGGMSQMQMGLFLAWFCALCLTLMPLLARVLQNKIRRVPQLPKAVNYIIAVGLVVWVVAMLNYAKSLMP